MSVTVTLYSFTKRENSTKQPISGGTDYSCIMMDDTSLMNPTFKLSIASNPIGKNYAYVADFNRYYFITDISTYQNFWYISCTCDVLASFKTEIGNGEHYVMRSASAWDTYIVDMMYSTKAGEHAIKNVAASDPMSWTLGHTYVVGIVGYADSPSDMTGSVTYYAMNEYTMKGFIYFLMHEVTQYSDITTAEYSDPGVQEVLINPIQYIVSCMALPITPPSTAASGMHIWFGFYDYPVDSTDPNVGIVRLGPGSVITETFHCSIGKHPQASTRGKYLNGAPYMSHTLHFGPIGDIPLDPGDLIDYDEISGSILIDKQQGMARILVYPTSDSANILYTGTFSLGVQINLSQVLQDTLSRAANVNAGIMSVGQSFFKLDFFGTLNAANTTFDTAARSKYPQVMGGGTNGSLLQFFDPSNIYVVSKYYDIFDENLTELGRPLCQSKVINTLSGYIICNNADCQISGTQDEAQKINGYMNGGFFYE